MRASRVVPPLADCEHLERSGRRLGAARVDVQHAVAAQLLRAIERLIGRLDQARKAALGAGLRDRGADAYRNHARGVRIAVLYRLRHDVAPQLLGERARVEARRGIQNEGELLAAVARTKVERPPRRVADCACYAANAVVSGLMTVEVVEALEVVDVD